MSAQNSFFYSFRFNVTADLNWSDALHMDDLCYLFQ